MQTKLTNVILLLNANDVSVFSKLYYQEIQIMHSESMTFRDNTKFFKNKLYKFKKVGTGKIFKYFE